MKVTPPSKHLNECRNERIANLAWVIDSALTEIEHPQTLDLCCGESLFADSHRSRSYTGVDADEGIIESNRERWPLQYWVCAPIGDVIGQLAEIDYDLLISTGCDDDAGRGNVSDLVRAVRLVIESSRPKFIFLEHACSVASVTYAWALRELPGMGYRSARSEGYVCASCVPRWALREWVLWERET